MQDKVVILVITESKVSLLISLKVVDFLCLDRNGNGGTAQVYICEDIPSKKRFISAK